MSDKTHPLDHEYDAFRYPKDNMIVLQAVCAFDVP